MPSFSRHEIVLVRYPYVFDHPEILDDLPDKAVLVFLDAKDQEFNEANIEMAAASPLPTESERVYVQMRRHVRVAELVEWEAEIVSSPYEL